MHVDCRCVFIRKLLVISLYFIRIPSSLPAVPHCNDEVQSLNLYRGGSCGFDDPTRVSLLKVMLLKGTRTQKKKNKKRRKEGRIEKDD